MMKRVLLICGLFTVIGTMSAADDGVKDTSTPPAKKGVVRKIVEGVVEHNKIPIAVAAGAAAGVVGTLAYQNREKIQKSCSIQ